jgi:hypothetical protein
VRDVRVAWQSAGATGEPWIGPDILDYLDTLAAEGVRACCRCRSVRVRPPRDPVRPRRRGDGEGRVARHRVPPHAAAERAADFVAALVDICARAVRGENTVRVDAPPADDAQPAGAGRGASPIHAEAALALAAAARDAGRHGERRGERRARSASARAAARSPSRRTRLTADGLRAHHPGLVVEVVTITTTGDVRTDVPLAAIGGRGVFAAELEQALRRGEIDVAVHSSKDLPSTLAAGVRARRVPAARGPARRGVHARAAARRAAARRARRHEQPAPRACQLRPRARPAGRGHPRQRRHAAPAARRGQYDAILLAAAGLHRLGLAHRITETLDAA